VHIAINNMTWTTRSVFLFFKKHGGTVVRIVDSLKFTVKSQNKKTEDKDSKNKSYSGCII